MVAYSQLPEEYLSPIIGALPSTTSAPATGEEVAGYGAIPVYELETQAAPSNLQDVYGTAALPMFEFVRKIQSGVTEYDPQQFSDDDLFTLNAATPEQLAEQGVNIETRDMILQGAKFAGGAVISKAGAMTPSGVGQSGAFLENIPGAVESFLPSGLGGAPPSLSSQLSIDTGSVAVPSNVMDVFNKYGAPIPTTGNVQTIGGVSYFPANEGLVQNSIAAVQQVNPQAFAGGGATTFLGQPGMGAPSTDITKGIVSRSPGLFGEGGSIAKGFTRSVPSLGQVGMTFGLDFGFRLLAGEDVKTALKKSAVTTAGTAIGTVVGGPIGGFIGGTIGNIISSGSVICSELHRQGEISDSIHRITNYYCASKLSTTHIKGYHFWAVPVVRRLRKGKQVKTWKYIYTHWANHICYQAKVRKKFDPIGWAISNTLEPLSLVMGKIYELTTEKRILGHADS